MSVYRRLDEGIRSEIEVRDVRLPSKAAGGATAANSARPASPARAPTRDAPELRRKAAPANVPFAGTLKWAAGLPRAVRPIALLGAFPRIANVLAHVWNDPTAFRGYMFELLVDRRGGRQGFPPPVQLELLALRAYFDENHQGARAPGTHVAR
jgi:hypothetical protein